MKKNTRIITSLLLGGITISSIVLALHFYSFKTDFQEVSKSHEQLNEKYKTVQLENEELRDTTIVLYDEAKKSSGLLEQSAMEIERLNTENGDLKGHNNGLKKTVSSLDLKANALQTRVDSLQTKAANLQDKVTTLEKK
jgi:chromosome segregation ATPase